MKGLNLFLATCFVVPTLNGAMADNVKNSTRATSSTRNQTTTTTTGRNTGNIKQRNTTNSRTTSDRNIVQRTQSQPQNVKNRSTSQTRETSVKSRVATKLPTMTRTAARIAATTHAKRSGFARSATTSTKTRESIMQRDFSKCKTVFFDCMDEFCANKDAQLKRCACSTRTNEFKATQKSLDDVEDKLLDFSQLLLKVNMDPADAAAINTATVGEQAYYETKDKTASKKTLDEIAKKLNSDFDSAGKNNMSALSWSLNTDAAFDSVDSLAGSATTAKSGIALRNAALPICREMATEVCSEEDISLVENSYNMAIEQDCNTVKKAYETQTQSARTKILESSALLDMTRLNTYQDNNSDDILTCKSKMLDMLSNTNVCGTDLTKCLDISGRYINPTTGEAFLSPELVNISKLISRPENNNTWANTPNNSSFVSYLNDKKKYIEPATKNCQTIADDVWKDFIEDALAQIKLAQNAKLEEVRQSCTTLLSECLDRAKTDLSEFDSRALSTFGVATDKTVNALCENIKTSCTTIMEYSPDETAVVSIDPNDPNARINWTDGTTDIAAAETYNTIINTCREVGRDCIINSCKSITGNFGLCESIHGSVNRHAILNRSTCWQQVYDCVKDASEQSVMDIHKILPSYDRIPQDLYEAMYGKALAEYNDYMNQQAQASNSSYTPDNIVFDICRDQGSVGACTQNTATQNDVESAECYYCRIAEQIWGHCKSVADNSAENPILIPTDPNTSTLLSWFAKNTHTNGEIDSCAVSICPVGHLEYTVNSNTMCLTENDVISCTIGNRTKNILCRSDSSYNVTNNPFVPHRLISPSQPPSRTCCSTEVFDSWGNCCMDYGVTETIADYTGGLLDSTITGTTRICTQNRGTTRATLLSKQNNTTDTEYILCTGTVNEVQDPNGMSINCSGQYIILRCTSSECVYIKPECQSGSNCAYDAVNRNYNINYFINTNIDSNSNNINGYCLAVFSPSDPNAATVCKLANPVQQTDSPVWDCTATAPFSITPNAWNYSWMVKLSNN